MDFLLAKYNATRGAVDLIAATKLPITLHKLATYEAMPMTPEIVRF
jgi:hypothetical protein